MYKARMNTDSYHRLSAPEPSLSITVWTIPIKQQWMQFIFSSVLYLFFFLSKARFCEEKGISLQVASTLYLVLGLCSVFARILVGRICDYKFVDQRFVYQGCLFVLGFSTLLCPLANSFPTVLVYFIAFGLFDGGQSTVANVLVLTSVQERQKARAFGLWLFCLSIIMACGPPLAGR